jgi:hypothetical protein
MMPEPTSRMRIGVRVCAAWLVCAAWAGVSSAAAGSPAPAGFAAAGPTGFGAASMSSWSGAEDPLATSEDAVPDLTPRGMGETLASPLAMARRGIMGDGRSKNEPSRPPFGTQRAKILLRSLTVPGWGQATVGRNTSAWVFGLAEIGIWTSFTAFKVQEQLRRESYENTAQLFAGVNLNGRDDEFRRIVGAYLSSDDYNQLVVFRDAANLYYDDPAAYRQYIAEHAIGGSNAWSWSSVDALLRYRGQRQREQRAANRANTALAVAIGNRILSAIHAARFAGTGAPEARRWELEYEPGLDQASDFRLGVRTRF